LSASTSLQTTQSLESATAKTENITGMIVETVLETYVLFNYGEIGIVMLELAVFMFFNTLNNSRCSWFAFLIPIHFIVKDCVMNIVKQIYNQYFLFCRQKHSFS